MSDAMSEASRAARASEEIQFAARRLAIALDEIRDAVFGYPSWALDDANRQLQSSGVRLVTITPNAEKTEAGR